MKTSTVNSKPWGCLHVYYFRHQSANVIHSSWKTAASPTLDLLLLVGSLGVLLVDFNSGFHL